MLADVDKYQREDPTLRRRRGGWRTIDRKLREIRSHHRFETVDDLARLIPAGLPDEFTTADLATAAGTSRARAQKMAYCLKANLLFEAVGRSRQGVVYRLP